MRAAFWSCALLAAAGCRGAAPLDAPARGPALDVEGEAAWDGELSSTRRRALAEAQRRAVEEALGVEVRGRTTVAQGRATDQRLESRSAGRIRGFRVLSETREESSLKVRIRAWVSPGPEAPRAMDCAGEPALKGGPRLAVVGPVAARHAVRCGLAAQGLTLVDEPAQAQWTVRVWTQAGPLPPPGAAFRGLESWRARVELAASRAGSGEFLGEQVRESSAVGFSPELARDKAVARAAFEAAEELGLHLRRLWEAAH